MMLIMLAAEMKAKYWNDWLMIVSSRLEPNLLYIRREVPVSGLRDSPSGGYTRFEKLLPDTILVGSELEALDTRQNGDCKIESEGKGKVDDAEGVDGFGQAGSGRSNEWYGFVVGTEVSSTVSRLRSSTGTLEKTYARSW